MSEAGTVISFKSHCINNRDDFAVDCFRQLALVMPILLPYPMKRNLFKRKLGSQYDSLWLIHRRYPRQMISEIIDADGEANPIKYNDVPVIPLI